MKFKLHSNYQPRGDQPAAIDQLYSRMEAGEKHQVLLGVTGSGKTFTMAKLIEKAGRPALVLAHNKTCAVAASACAATWSKSIPLMRIRRTASKCGATRSIRCGKSIRSPVRCAGDRKICRAFRFIRRRTT